MEWSSEKIIQLLPIVVSVGLPVYMYFRTQRDKKATETKDDKAEITSEILADGSSIRRERGEQLKELGVRYDTLFTAFENLREEIIELKSNIIDLRAEVKELKYVNMTQEQEKQQLKEKNDKLLAEKVLLQNEIRDLRARVGDLEKQVKNLIERERSG